LADAPEFLKTCLGLILGFIAINSLTIAIKTFLSSGSDYKRRSGSCVKINKKTKMWSIKKVSSDEDIERILG